MRFSFGVGALIFIGTAAAFGWMLQDEITNAIDKLAAFGLWGALAAVTLLGLYVAAKWMQRQLFIRSLRMSRITADKLRCLIDEGQKVLILDVRPLEVRPPGASFRELWRHIPHRLRPY